VQVTYISLKKADDILPNQGFYNVFIVL